MGVKKDKYRLIIYSTPDLDPQHLSDMIREVFAYDVTQIGNILNILAIKGSYRVKSYKMYRDAMEDCKILFAYGVDCEVERILE